MKSLVLSILFLSALGACGKGITSTTSSVAPSSQEKAIAAAAALVRQKESRGVMWGNAAQRGKPLDKNGWTFETYMGFGTLLEEIAAPSVPDNFDAGASYFKYYRVLHAFDASPWLPKQPSMLKVSDAFWVNDSGVSRGTLADYIKSLKEASIPPPDRSDCPVSFSEER